MAYRCDLCNKKTRAGRSRTHKRGVAGGQWKKRAPVTLRKFKPNLHNATVTIKGVETRVKACAKCIKRIKFENKKLEEQVHAKEKNVQKEVQKEVKEVKQAKREEKKEAKEKRAKVAPTKRDKKKVTKKKQAKKKKEE